MERQDGRNRPGGEDGPALHVAAFGKHPGWNDHIDDLGLDTARLVEVKRRMYVEGIAGNIDSGVWDKLAADHVVDGVAHVFVWRTPGDIVVGRMWPSRDGKGRSKYPMVLCAECVGAPLAWAVHEALPVLAEAQHRCEAATDAASVRSIVDQTRAELRRRAAAHPPRGPELLVSDRTLGELARAPEMGPDAVGVRRLMYQIEREMGDFLPAHLSATRSRVVEARPRHLRAPACRRDPADVLTLWTQALMCQLAPTVELLLVHAEGTGWVDAIVGPPDVPSFYCLRASPRALAMVSEVPYDLDPEFVARAQRRIHEGGSAEQRAIGGDPRKEARTVVSKPGSRGRKTTIIIGVLLGLAVAAVGLGFLLERLRAEGASPTRSASPEGTADNRDPGR